LIRLTLLILFVLFLWVYAFRDWMVSLCGLILLTVLMQKDDMPSYVAGIQGLNLWNLTLVVVTMGWLLQRRSERQSLNLSRFAIAAAGGYVTIIVLAYVQAMLHIDSFPADLNLDPAQLLTVDYLINPLKFIWVAFLLAKGCNSPRRLRLALGTLVTLGVLYAIMVVKVMPLESLQEGGAGILQYRNRINRQVGLHANNMAKVLTLTFWSILATQRLWWRAAWWSKGAVLVAYPVTFLGMALCYSRAGYLTFAAVGRVIGCVRWR